MSLRVLLVGAEAAATQVLRDMAADGHQVVAVLVEDPDGLGAPLARRADQLGLPQRPVAEVKDSALAHWISDQKIDILVNVHSLSIIDGAVAAAPRIGSFNLHPGPLPTYAGLNVVSWAIAQGETSHAVTLHWIEPEIDTGHIASSARFPIGPDDTGLSVFSQCVRLGVPLVRELLSAAALDPTTIPTEDQVGERRVYRRRDRPGGGRMVWTRPAQELHNLARACDFGPFPSPCGHPTATLDGTTLEVVGTSLTGEQCQATPPGTVTRLVDDDPQVVVASGDQWLALTRLRVDGQPVAAADVIPTGAVLGDGPES